MKKAIAIAIALGALGSTQAFAQTKNFEGFHLGASLEIDQGSHSASDGSSGNGHKTGLGLQARYDWAIDNQFLIGLGVSAGTGHRHAGNYTSGVGADTKDRYAIDVMPGYAINNNLLVYGKVSALSAKALSDDGSGTAIVRGTGYGIGLRGLIDNRTYWQAGLDTNHYRNVGFGSGTSSSLKDNVVSVGMGYRF